MYGETGETVVDENQKYNPNTDFVKIRLDAEKYLKENSDKHKIDFAVVHFGDVYGPDGWFYDMLVKRLKKRIIIPRRIKSGKRRGNSEDRR